VTALLEEDSDEDMPLDSNGEVQIY